MIALDTNVLVRYFVGDDPVQAQVARNFIEQELSAETPGLVTVVAMIELHWVLRNVYGLTADVVADILRRMLSITQLVIEAAEAVEVALDMPHGDLADRLIHAIGRANGCAKTVTFDQKFSRLAGVELLAMPE